jgi:hypothetical protein
MGVAKAPSVLTLVSLIPLRCPRSESDTTLISEYKRVEFSGSSPTGGESGWGVATGEIPGRGESEETSEAWE